MEIYSLKKLFKVYIYTYIHKYVKEGERNDLSFIKQLFLMQFIEITLYFTLYQEYRI